MTRRSQRYARFFALVGTTAYFQVRDLKSATEAARDCSAANVAAHFRATLSPPGAGSTTFLVDVTLTKTLNPDGSDGAVTAGSTGWFRGTIEFPAPYAQVLCEVVLLDLNTARTTGTILTPSGYLEEIVEDRWIAVVEPSTTRS